MKRLLLLSTLMFMGLFYLNAQNVWINEFHYDNAGTDEGEFIEIVLENAGSYDLSMFGIYLYNGNNSSVYDPILTLDQFTQDVTSGDYTFFYFNYTDAGESIQNGSPDGLALSYDNVLIDGQFLSYEGVITAVDGPAAGSTSTDIGVSEDSSTPIGESLQLSGTGTSYSEFIWEWPAGETKGNLNNNQQFGAYVPDPEPTNYPTDFDATAEGFSITLTWTDATGEQLPYAYLVYGSDEDNIGHPLDGTPVVDDPDLSDGTAAVNVAYGFETLAFAGLATGTTYHFKIFPYTNQGEDIDYKTDGIPPSASASTSDLVVISFEDFEEQNSLGTYSQFSVTGDQIWEWYTYSGDNFVRMSGYDEGPVENDDWLISPSMNFNNYINETLTFITARFYDGPELVVKISTDYDGTSDPYDATWSDLDAELSTGNWEWTGSGEVDVSGYNGTAVHLAFQYTSTDQESATWEVDNILVVGEENVGVGEMNEKLSFKYYPNPVTDILNIELKSGTYEVKIYSIDGRLFYSNQINGGFNKLDLSSFIQGMYFINVRNTETGNNSTVKINFN